MGSLCRLRALLSAAVCVPSIAMSISSKMQAAASIPAQKYVAQVSAAVMEYPSCVSSITRLKRPTWPLYETPNP